LFKAKSTRERNRRVRRVELKETRYQVQAAELAQRNKAEAEKNQNGGASIKPDTESLARHLTHLSELIYSSLWPCAYQENLSFITSSQIQKRAERLLDGLVGVWLAGSRYRLIRKGIDPLESLLQVYEQLAAREGWFTPPDLAAAVVELLYKFQPKSLLTTTMNKGGNENEQWQPSQAQGLAICQAMHALNQWPTQVELWFEAYLELEQQANSKLEAGPLLDRLAENVPNTAAVYRQLNIWSELEAETDPAANNIKQDSTLVNTAVVSAAQSDDQDYLFLFPSLVTLLNEADAAELELEPFYRVSGETQAQELVGEFERRLGYYRAFNAAILDASQLGTGDTASDSRIETEAGAGAADGGSPDVKATATRPVMDLFSQAEQLAVRPALIEDIPRLVLTRFKAGPELTALRRRATRLALYALALKAYADGISLPKTLPQLDFD